MAIATSERYYSGFVMPTSHRNSEYGDAVMEENKDEKLAQNFESLAFVDRALRLDREKFLELTKKLNELIDVLQKSGTNPVTIYYITRAIDGYAQDKLKAFGKAVEQDRPPESTITADNLKHACDQLFAVALEDAARMSSEEQQKLMVEQEDLRKKTSSRLSGYA
jgi:hypothetical protein